MKVRVCIAVASLTALAACAVAAASAATREAREPAAGPDPAVSIWKEWPHQVSCLGGLPFDPVAAFSGPTRAERGSSFPARALRRVLASGELPGVRQHRWRLLSETGRSVEFAAGPLFAEPYPGSTSELEWVRLYRGRKGWKLGSFTSGCMPQSIRSGIPATPWSLVPSQHLNADTREIRIQLSPPRCDEVTLLAPEVREQNGALLLTIWVAPVRRGIVFCPGGAAEPLVIDLTEKLGDRQLFDGGTYPPRPAVRPLYG